ncbi:unnamed protein product [Musa hybrid cultivar]
MADNTVHQVEKEGTVIISDKYNDPIILKSVYYISGMKKNLFFVANLVDSRNYVLLSPNEIKFLHNIKKLNADVVYIGKRIKDLYILSTSIFYFDRMSENDDASIWHARHGHINFLKLKIIIQKNQPFDISLSRFKFFLELIHNNLMGPILTPSYSSSRYILLFINDFTRFTWVYFVKEKLEVFQNFKNLS